MQRRIWALTAIICALLILAGARARADARAYILIEMDTGRVLYEKNADERLAVASVTKIMTCLLALENSDPGEIVTAGKNASGVNGTSIYLSEGESLTMEQMLYGLMLRSGNDAAVAIAEHISKSAEGFAELMNERAAELGADAYFTTPNGLDEGGNGASARAIALISREAMQNEAFRKIVSTKKAVIPWKDHDYERVLTNKNRLLTTCEGALGIKTGYTKKAGRCLAFAAERNGMTMIGCVLNCPDWFDCAEELLDKGEKEYSLKTFLYAGDTVRSFLIGGKELNCTIAEDMRAPVREGEEFEIRTEFKKAEIPSAKGDTAGWAHLYIGGEKILSREIVYQNSVEKRSCADALSFVMSLWTIM